MSKTMSFYLLFFFLIKRRYQNDLIREGGLFYIWLNRIWTFVNYKTWGIFICNKILYSMIVCEDKRGCRLVAIFFNIWQFSGNKKIPKIVSYSYSWHNDIQNSIQKIYTSVFCFYFYFVFIIIIFYFIYTVELNELSETSASLSIKTLCFLRFIYTFSFFISFKTCW